MPSLENFVRGHRMLILWMTLWIVSFCNAVGGFNSLRTLAMGDLCTLMVLSCLFSANRWTRYFARVTYIRYWKNLEEDRPPYPLQCLGSDAIYDITDNVQTARYWGRGMLGMYWNSATLVSIMGGRRLSCSSNGCHGQDGCWEATGITVVLWESLIFWWVWGTMGAGGKAYTRPKPSQDMERASTAQALSSG